MAGRPWFDGYEERRQEDLALRDQYVARCRQLGANPLQINDSVWREMIARIVHESNWQEDLYLDAGRTRELANAVFDDPITAAGPHLDMNGIVRGHKEKVIQLIRQGRSTEEIAAYNLSRAHEGIKWIAAEVWVRRILGLFAYFEGLEKQVEGAEAREDQKAQVRAGLAKVKELYKPLLDRIGSSSKPMDYPFQGGPLTADKWVSSILAEDYENLVAPVAVDQLHFLHRITMMGLTAASKCGKFRDGHVHVTNNYDLMLPPPEVVPSMMEEFCNDLMLLPAIQDSLGTGKPLTDILLIHSKPDRIKEAARLSHWFVRIHPYADGNGRMSRIVMNMVLWGVYPPVYLKADRKGRHRYGWALRKADNSNIEPLACLIAISLKKTYKRLLASVTPPQKEPPA